MGYVYKRGRKLWIGYRDAEGAERQKSTGLSIGQEKKAQALLAEIESRIAAREAFDVEEIGPLTVRRYFERWIQRRRDRGVVAVGDDETRIRKHALGHLGDLEIEKVRTRHVRDLFHSLLPKVRTGKMAPKSAHNLKGVLHKLFKDAVIDELITANPVVLAEEDLPAKTDKDPSWRKGAIFTRAEIEILISDERIPLYRRVRYALLFFASVREGEGAALCFSDYESHAKPLGRLLINKQWHTKQKKIGPLKTAFKGIVEREMPVHPVLARILAEWRLSGWTATYGRAPRDTDLIIPNPFVPGRGRRTGSPETHVRSDTVWSDLDVDCKALGFRHRRTHDLRRAFISIATADGARRDLLQWGTHGRPQASIMDVYTEVWWPTLCEEVAKLKIEAARGQVIALPKAAIAGGSDLQSTYSASKDSRKQVEKRWSRRESNPRPKADSRGTLRA
jgi:integrase